MHTPILPAHCQVDLDIDTHASLMVQEVEWNAESPEMGVDGLFLPFHFSESFLLVPNWKFTSKGFRMAQMELSSTGKYRETWQLSFQIWLCQTWWNSHTPLCCPTAAPTVSQLWLTPGQLCCRSGTKWLQHAARWPAFADFTDLLWSPAISVDWQSAHEARSRLLHLQTELLSYLRLRFIGL